MRRLLRWATLVAVLASGAQPQQSSGSHSALTREQALADFDQFCQMIGEKYAYFSEKHISWARACEIYRPRAASATSARELLPVLEEAIAELYDDHATLGRDIPGSPNIVPSNTDLWGSWHDGAAIIDEVRPEGVAWQAGLRNGDEVLAIGQAPVAAAVARAMPRTLTSPDTRARDWALRRVLAGRRGQTRDITVRHSDGKSQRVSLEAAKPLASEGLLESRLLPEGIGYIRLHNSLGDSALVAAFDSALEQLKTAPAIVLDLRDTPGGGSNDVAEPILGRFIEHTSGYQKFVVPARGARGGRKFTQKVQPHGPFSYRGRVVVLVDHWTASMGEGVAVGLAGMRRATVVGTPMAGLNGGVYTSTLKFTGIPFNYPTERIYTMNDTPRERFRPDVAVELAGAKVADPILARALEIAIAKR